MAINIITYGGKTRTAKHDAMVYDAALNRSGIFNGCAVSANADVLTVELGYGIIKGRVFEITREQFPIELPGSGTVKGALVVTLDLGSDEPLILENLRSNVAITYEHDEDVNFANTRYQMPIATYDITSTGITNVVQAAHFLPADHIGSTNFNDYTEPGVYYFFGGLGDYSNVPGGSVNGWLVVYDGRMVDSDSGTIKQIFYRHGSSSTHYQTFVRTKTGGVWNSWNKFVMDSDLDNIDKNIMFGNRTDRTSSMISVNSKTRQIGLHVSAGQNAGIWDIGFDKWILVSNKDGDVTIPHKLFVSSFSPANIDAGNSTDTTTHYIRTQNKYRSIQLNVSNSENAGIWDNKQGDWLIRSDKSYNTYIPHPLSVSGKLTAPKSIVRGTGSITVAKVNTAAYKDITWAEMAGVPTVVITPSTSVPHNVSVGYGNVTKTGCRVYLTRSDGAGGATGFSYIAICT